MVIFIVNKHTHKLVNTEDFEQWRKDTWTQTCDTNPPNVAKKEQREQHTHAWCTIKSKWILCIIAITFFWEKRDHKNNWDYLKRHPQELGFKMTDILEAVSNLQMFNTLFQDIKILILWNKVFRHLKIWPTPKNVKILTLWNQVLNIPRLGRPKQMFNFLMLKICGCGTS